MPNNTEHTETIITFDSKVKSALYVAVAVGCVIGGFIATGIFIMYLM